MEAALIVSSVLLWLVVLLNFLLTLALVRRIKGEDHHQTQSPFAQGLKPGEDAPDFTAQTLNGETVMLSIYAGRKTAFVFFGVHCKPCKELLPHFELLRPKALQARDELILVSVDEAEETRALIDTMNIHLPVIIAPRETNSLMADYKTTSTPSYCLLDARGKVLSSGYPSMEWGQWKEQVDVWNRQPVPVTNERR